MEHHAFLTCVISHCCPVKSSYFHSLPCEECVAVASVLFFICISSSGISLHPSQKRPTQFCCYKLAFEPILLPWGECLFSCSSYTGFIFLLNVQRCIFPCQNVCEIRAFTRGFLKTSAHCCLVTFVTTLFFFQIGRAHV